MSGKVVRPLVIWGAAGQAKVVADAARAGGWEVVGFLDDIRPDIAGQQFCGAPLLGTLANWLRQPQEQRTAIALGVGDNTARLTILRLLLDAHITPEIIVHPAASVSPTASLGPGTVVMAGAVVQSDAHVGAAVIVNTLAGVDHDSRIGDGCHISVNAVLAGHVTLGELVVIGPGVTVCAGKTVGAKTVVGAGAVVLHDLPEGIVAVGTPARRLKQNS